LLFGKQFIEVITNEDIIYISSMSVNVFGTSLSKDLG